LAIAGLDQVIVDDLLEMGGEDLFYELATLSCADIARSTVDLDQGFRQSDADAVARSAHAIAGVSAGIGATRLTELAGMLERLAMSGDLESAGTLCLELAENSTQVRGALEAHMAKSTMVTKPGAATGAQAVEGPAILKFLIVDDAPATRRFVRAVLDSVTSFEVVGEASTDKEAIELARSLQPDLILLDLSLGAANGADILPDLIRVAPATRVVILSRAPAGAAEATLAAGAIGHIVKGLQASELIDRLSAVIGMPLLLKPRHAAEAVEAIPTVHVALARAVVFDADLMTRRTINRVLAESKVQIISEVIPTDNAVDVLCSAVQLIGPGLIVLGDVPHVSPAGLISRLRELVPDTALINYSSDQPLGDANPDPAVHVVPRGDVERLTSCVRDLLTS
jgi:DNA-binding NarL/FixJ family response regulator